MTDLSLFPVINPNIEEIIEREDALDGDDVIIDEEKELGHNDIFTNKKISTRQNVKMEIAPKKDKYSHLVEARKKGAITRQKKAEAKRIAKAEAKAIKDEEKRLRREATTERNRVKARERYRREKSKKDEQSDIKEKIRLESHAKKQKQVIQHQQWRGKTPVAPKPEGMNFEKFAGYMMRYEGLKREYAASQTKKSIPKPIQEKPPQEFPDNYPLSHLYSKNKNRRADFSHF
tara:strand:+ start:10666 stop:11361 length:696 start_codon:yes stop_codon:yes gene_type:complete